MVSLLATTFLICILSISHLNQAMQEAESDPTQELLNAMKSDFKPTQDDAEKAMRAVIRGANVNVPDEEANTPLHFAISINYMPLAELLIKMKADPNMKGDIFYGTPLQHAACVRENGKRGFYKSDLVKLLLDNGARMNNLLHRASHCHEVQLMEILLDKKANIDERSDFAGMVPLHMAYEFSAAKLLLERGADWEIEDNNGQRPSDTNNVFRDPRFLHLIQQRREEIQKQFVAPATIIIHATVVGQEEGIAKIIAEYAVPDLEDCNMALKRSIDKFNQRV